MGFWNRRGAAATPKLVSPSAYFRQQVPVLAAQLRGAFARVAERDGVSAASAQEAFELALPGYLALERAAAQCAASRLIALEMVRSQSIDGRMLREVTDLDTQAQAAYLDLQQSFGLLLFYPERNGRLVPTDVADVDGYNEAIALGQLARARFVQWWRANQLEHMEDENNWKAAYDLAYLEFTTATGRKVTRF